MLNDTGYIYISNLFSDSSFPRLTEYERKCLDIQLPEEQKKSKYDLPIEFHLKTYENYLKSGKTRSHYNIDGFMGVSNKKFEKYILSQKTSVMFLCESQKSNRNSIFQNLKEKHLVNALKARPCYYAVSLMAIHILRSNVLSKLHVIAENELCPSLRDIPYKLFSWSPHDYYKRRQLDNTVWLDVFERDYKKYLEAMKFKFDMKELCRYLDMILCGALVEDTDFSFENSVITPLEDASDILGLYTSLKSEVVENRRYIIELRLQYDSISQTSQAQEGEGRSTIMTQLTEVDITYPIRYRYSKAWYEAQGDQVELKQENEFKRLTNLVAEWKAKIDQENMAIQNSYSILFQEIERYKIKTNEINAKFENEFDDLENAINYKRMSMAKIDQQRKYCEETIEFMREKVERVREQKLIAEAEQLRLTREHAEESLMKLAREQAKRKKKQKQKQKALKKK